jgi:hypothetical protein
LSLLFLFISKSEPSSKINNELTSVDSSLFRLGHSCLMCPFSLQMKHNPSFRILSLEILSFFGVDLADAAVLVDAAAVAAVSLRRNDLDEVDVVDCVVVELDVVLGLYGPFFRSRASKSIASAFFLYSSKGNSRNTSILSRIQSSSPLRKLFSFNG